MPFPKNTITITTIKQPAMKRHRVILTALAFASAALLCQCESTDGSTLGHPRIEEDQDRSMMPGMGGQEMIYGYRISSGSSGSGWRANPNALNNPGLWR